MCVAACFAEEAVDVHHLRILHGRCIAAVAYNADHWLVTFYCCSFTLTSSWPHLRYDVGLEEGEYK